MNHKKQSYEQLIRTQKWNTLRGNTPDTIDWKLELDMLQEELDELREAVEVNDRVAQFDAMLDLKFVLYGTIGKAGITPEQEVEGYEAVLRANESKSSTKNAAGKITKPDNFIGPEAELLQILNRT